MKNKYITHIIISFLIIVALWSYYTWKLSSYNEVNNIETKQEFRNIWNFSVEEFKKKIEEDYILIDIRTPWEIAKWYIKWLDMRIDYYEDNFKSQIEKLDKTKKYLIYCRSWSRSWNALYLMKNLWFKDVHDLAWWIWIWEEVWEKFEKIKTTIIW